MVHQSETQAIELLKSEAQAIEPLKSEAQAIEFLKSKNVVQHNSLITARYEMSASEKDIFYLLLAQLRDDDPIDKVYHIYVQDIALLTNKEVNYMHLDQATTRLLTRVYYIKQGHEILKVCLISSARHIRGRGQIVIRIDPEMRPYLFNLKEKFTMHSLYMAMSLPSMYSKRFYEMLSQFKNTGVMRLQVDELKSRLCVLDSNTGKDKYANWTDFSKNVIEVARRELSEHTDINFEYVARKRGKKFTDLEFKILHIKNKNLSPSSVPDNTQQNIEVRNPEIDNTGPISEHIIYERLTERNKLSKWQAELILKHVPKSTIHRTLYEIQIKNINGEIRNMGGFTANTFEKLHPIGLLGQSRKN